MVSIYALSTLFRHTTTAFSITACNAWLRTCNFFTAGPKVSHGQPGTEETRQGSLQQDLHGQGHQEDLRSPEGQDHQGAA